MDIMDVLETDNRWVQALLFVGIWVIIFLTIGLALGKDPLGQVVQGVVSGVAFGAVYTYLQKEE